MLAENLIDFIGKSPSVFHVIENSRQMLLDKGFEELFEDRKWNIKRGGKYFITRNGSAMISFVIPNQEVHSLLMIASHSDSPTFRIKNDPEISVEKKYITLNTEKYGGMIISSWFDRPLSMAGRVAIETENGIQMKSVNIDRNSLIIPNLAIHMDRNVNEGYKYNPQKDTLPLFRMDGDKRDIKEFLAKEMGLAKDDIISYELYLYNREAGFIWGSDNEFLSAPKLDDLQCTYVSLLAIADARPDKDICMSLIFDNEEVGSGSLQGADSDFLEATVDRMLSALELKADKYEILAKSFLISADNAHAVHPNHADKADPTNRPYINGGVVIKHNAAMKYATNCSSEALFVDLCKRAGVMYQTYFNRSDIAGGSTLGNISLSHISIKSVDIGLPQLAMHSAFETAGTKDMEDMLLVFKKYFE